MLAMLGIVGTGGRWSRPGSSLIRPGSRPARAHGRRPGACPPVPREPPGPGRPPTAVFATNDLIAFGAVRGFHEAGVRIPDDVALVGFHGVELSRLTIPSLTTVELRATELGRIGAEMLFSLLDGIQPEEPERVLPVHLVVRESCGGLSALTPRGPILSRGRGGVGHSPRASRAACLRASRAAMASARATSA